MSHREESWRVGAGRGQGGGREGVVLGVTEMLEFICANNKCLYYNRYFSVMVIVWVLIF